MFNKLRLWWHQRTVRRKMNRVFGRGADPYDYAKNPYEVARLAAMADAVGAARDVLEIGAAEGLFTRKLLERERRVTGLELSPVAAARARAAAPGADIVETDVRGYEPAKTFDAVVCGDVLYYMDKPMVRAEFEAVFPRIAGWVCAGGRLVLAHGFVGGAERAIRQGYRERFEKLGLRLVEEKVIGKPEEDGGICCLLSVLER